MLTVVQHDEHAPASDDTREGVHRRTPGLVGQPQRARHGDRHDVGVGDGRQIDVPHAVAEIGVQLGCDLHCQTCLSDAARTGKRHKPGFGDVSPHGLDLGAATDETRELRRKMLCRRSFRHAKRWKVVAEVGVAQLRYPFGPRQVPQRMGAEIKHPRARRRAHRQAGRASWPI